MIVPAGEAGAAGHDDRAGHAGLALWVIVALAIISVADLAFIFARQGWETEGGSNYFRFPITSDNERNLLLVRALIRGGASPFIPNSDLIYPVFWHNFAALLLQPVAAEIGFPQIAGVTLATAVVLFILIYFAVLNERPAVARHWPLVAIVVVLAVTHADLYHMLIGLAHEGAPSIEADHGEARLFFRTFSPKLLALTSPQHVCFMIFFFALYLLNHGPALSIGRGRMAGESLLVCAAVATSPVLAAMTLPLIYGLPALTLFFSNLRQGLADLARAAGLMLLSFLAFTGLYRFTPLILFFRTSSDAEQIAIPGVESVYKLALFPWIFVGIFGVAGLLVTLWLPAYAARRPARLLSFWPLLLISGTLIFYYGVSHPEISRHWSIVASVAGLMVLVQCLPDWENLRARRSLQTICAGGIGAAVLLHAFFIFVFTAKPSILDPEVAWHDYFCMNDVIEERHPGLPVAAANGRGLYFPLAARVTTSSSFNGNTAAVHSRLEGEQLRINNMIFYGREPLIDHAAALGYGAVIWGPVEDEAWGAERAAKFARPELLLASCGSVGLYRLSPPS